MRTDVKLGNKAKDKVTGFTGIITAKIDYMFGCRQYGIAPAAEKDKLGDTIYFDEGRIEILGNGIAPKEVQTKVRGGVNRDAPTRATKY